MTKLGAIARTYLLTHDEELGLPEEDLDGFEVEVKDLTEELDAAVSDRLIEWRDRRKAKLQARAYGATDDYISRRPGQ